MKIIYTILTAALLCAPSFAETKKKECKTCTACTTCEKKNTCSGVWTENIAQAFECAKKTGKKVFINFTGSDWCYWCIIAEKNIFSKPEWKEFAKKDLICLKVDFPSKNKPDVMTMAKRKALAEEFGIRGYPTFYLTDGNKKTLARFSAGRKDCETFIKEVKEALKK